MTLEGKGVLVTGGGTGIGRAVALALAREGCRVAVAGRRREKLEETAALHDGAPRIAWRAADVADRASAVELIRWAEGEVAPLAMLVSSAGINVRRRSLAEIDPADWDRLMAVNATGAFNCIAGVLPGMRNRGEGLIVNISSLAGRRALQLAGVAYCASKFAMSALGTYAGLEEGPRGIRVTNIYPGEVDTPILEDRPEPVSPEHRARILQPEDVAAAVLFVARLPARAHVPDLVIKPTAQLVA